MDVTTFVFFQMGEIEAAEEALNEANFMDIKNDEVWANLTVINVKMGNADEAKICYTKALEVISTKDKLYYFKN